MAEVVLKDIVKIYPYVDKSQKGKKTKNSIPKTRNLQITDKGVIAVQQFNLKIEDGEFVVLVGPSGCGKSTTLRMVAGLEEISEGELLINGSIVNSIEPKDRDIAMVFQSYALYPHMTVFNNMAYPLKILKQNITYQFEIEYVEYLQEQLTNEINEFKEKINELNSTDSTKNEGKIAKLSSKISNCEDQFKVLEQQKIEFQKKIDGGEISHFDKMSRGMRNFKVLQTAQMLNITEYLDRKPKNLSGGQRQRVAIGRACVRNPKVLLMDEPLSNLDAKLRNEMRAELIKLRKKIQTTFIYVTHDQTEAMTLGDRIVVMRDGFIQQVGTPQEVYDHPRNLFVSSFIGTPKMNYFDAKLVEENGTYYIYVDGNRVNLCEEKQERLRNQNVLSQDITLGVRPDHIVLSNDGVSGTVEVSELMGPTCHLHMNIMGKDTIVIVPTNGQYINYVGQTINLAFNGNVVHLFSKEDEHNLEFEAQIDSVDKANMLASECAEEENQEETQE